MAKKQVKIPVSQLENSITKYQMVNFIMSNGAVYLATPLTVKSDNVKVKNTKGHTLHLPLVQIEEIWAEEKAN